MGRAGHSVQPLYDAVCSCPQFAHLTGVFLSFLHTLLARCIYFVNVRS